jgi:hypothetical protein
LRDLLVITKLDKEKNECIREKYWARNIVKEIKQHQEKWLQHVGGIEYENKHYNINQKDEGT